MLSLNRPRYAYTLSLIFCKAMSRCSVDGQVSWPFPCEIIRDNRDVFAAATACIDSILQQRWGEKLPLFVEVTVHVLVQHYFEPWGWTYDLWPFAVSHWIVWAMGYPVSTESRSRISYMYMIRKSWRIWVSWGEGFATASAINFFWPCH